MVERFKSKGGGMRMFRTSNNGNGKFSTMVSIMIAIFALLILGYFFTQK